jgi:hypothetical protein
MGRRCVVMLVCVVVAGGLSGTTAGASTSTTKQFCNPFKTFNLLWGAQFNSVGAAPAPGQIAVVQPKFDKLVASLAKTAPAAIAADIKIVADTFNSGFANVVALQGQALLTFFRADSAADQWAITHCGYKVIDVTASDFTFTGLPTTLKPGFVAFNIKNDAAQLHRFAVVRLMGNDTAAEVAALPLAQAIKRVEVIPIRGFILVRGFPSVTYAQFTKPGRYGAVDSSFLAQKMYVQFTVK